jgi:hypothetical protein
MPVGDAQCSCRCHRLEMHNETLAVMGFGSKGWSGSLMSCCPPAKQGQKAVVGDCACGLVDTRFREKSQFVQEQELFRSVMG